MILQAANSGFNLKEKIMRKVFLASTALVALTSVASAADITVSGSSTFNYKSISDSAEYGAGKDGNSMAFDSSVSVGSTATSDSGLTYTTSADVFDANPVTNMSVSGDFGTIKILSDGSGDGDAAAMSGDVAADETTGMADGSVAGAVSFDGDEAVAGGHVSYASPSISGANIYLGYTDGGADNENTTTSMGIKYATEAAGASVTLGYASSSADGGADATSMGVSISSGAVALTLAANSSETTTGTATDYSGTSVGLTYTVSDAMAIQMHSKSAENDKDSDYDYSETAVSATYTIAPGLTSAITYTSYDYTNNDGDKQDGSATNVELKVAF